MLQLQNPCKYSWKMFFFYQCFRVHSCLCRDQVCCSTKFLTFVIFQFSGVLCGQRCAYDWGYCHRRPSSWVCIFVCTCKCDVTKCSIILDPSRKICVVQGVYVIFAEQNRILYSTLWKIFLFSADVIVILRFWAWNNPLFWPEHFFQALYGYFSSAQGGNLFRSKEGTVPEIFRKFPEFLQEIQEISGNLLGPLLSSSSSFFIIMGMVL